MHRDLIDLFSKPLLLWFDQHGRKHLPWKHPKSAYRIWIAEIMLQQTQVATVIPFFERFITKFPDINSLNQASEDDVLAQWSGLGYYSRARNIHKTAQLICSQFAGEFPQSLAELQKLPGIGPSTAAAIASQAFEQPTAIMDGNVARVLSRYFAVEGDPQLASVKKRLWHLAQSCMSLHRCADYTQAIMDLGATCCTKSKPQCEQCPLRASCQAFLLDKTSEYPFPKTKKIRPIKQEQFLLLHREDGRIYLERRPSPGLWGGLWCLPAIDWSSDAKTWIAEHYGIACLTMADIMEMKHSFTHFHLHIKAKSLLAAVDNAVKTPGRWFERTELDQIVLAKPVKQIILTFTAANAPFATDLT